jgi:hypothetical protein
METNNIRDFKGVWIPKEVWLDKRLNMLEKGILVEIDSLDNEDNGCFASNSHFAEFCQCSETKVSTAISKLIDLGYVYVKSFNGRTRILKSRLSNFERQTYKNLKADFKKVKDINTYNNTVINTIDKNNTPLPPIGEEVFAIVNQWNSEGIIVHDIDKWLTEKRNNLVLKAIKEYGLNEILCAIHNYATVLKDQKYTLFKYTWNLEQFLKQSNALPHFLNDGVKWLNYCQSVKGNKKVDNSLNSLYERYREEEI